MSCSIVSMSVCLPACQSVYVCFSCLYACGIDRLLASGRICLLARVLMDVSICLLGLARVCLFLCVLVSVHVFQMRVSLPACVRCFLILRLLNVYSCACFFWIECLLAGWFVGLFSCSRACPIERFLFSVWLKGWLVVRGQVLAPLWKTQSFFILFRRGVFLPNFISRS